MPIYPNVDLYSASLYYSLDIPIDLNTPIFAISRIAGWNAHIVEEKFAEAAPKPALYRPKAVYVGRYCGPMGCEYKNLINRTEIPSQKQINNFFNKVYFTKHWYNNIKDLLKFINYVYKQYHSAFRRKIYLL